MYFHIGKHRLRGAGPGYVHVILSNAKAPAGGPGAGGQSPLAVGHCAAAGAGPGLGPQGPAPAQWPQFSLVETQVCLFPPAPGPARTPAPADHWHWTPSPSRRLTRTQLIVMIIVPTWTHEVIRVLKTVTRRTRKTIPVSVWRAKLAIIFTINTKLCEIVQNLNLNQCVPCKIYNNLKNKYKIVQNCANCECKQLYNIELYACKHVQNCATI